MNVTPDRAGFGLSCRMTVLIPRVFLCLALLAPSALPAQGNPYAQRTSDTALTVQALQKRLPGQILTFYDDGRSEYYSDGRYTYTYAGDGGTAYGYWRIEADGTVCIDFVNGFARCDRYVLAGAQLVLLDEKGARYPVRPD